MKKKTTKTLDLLNFLNKVLIEKKLLKKNEVILIAMSGGQDSIVLLIIFFQLKNQWALKLGLVFCNHLWQVDSFSTMYHILRIAILLRMPSFFGLPLSKISSEQKARNWRQQAFKRISLFYSYKKIITAHTGSDRIETLFFHLIRGSGTEGIYSLKWEKAVEPNLYKDLFLNKILDSKKVLLKNHSYVLSSPVRQDSTTVSYYFNFAKVKLLQPVDKVLNKKHLHDRMVQKNQIFTMNRRISKKFNSQKSNQNFNITCFKSSFLVDQTKHEKVLVPKSLLCKKKYLLNLDPIYASLSYKLKKTLRSKTGSAYALTPETRLGLIPKQSFVAKKHYHSVVDLNFFFFLDCEIFYPLVDFKTNSKQTLKFTRPCLACNRFDIKNLCQVWELPLYPDVSNQKLQYYRNRIRKQLLPSLRFFFNPQIDNLLTQFIEITNDEQSYLNFVSNRILGQVEKRKTHQIELDFSGISFLPSGIQRRILRQFVEKNMKVKTNFSHIEALKKFLQKPCLIDSARSFQTKAFFFPKRGMLFIYSQKLVFISDGAV